MGHHLVQMTSHAPNSAYRPTKVCPERLVAARYQIIDLATNEAGALVPKVACEKWGELSIFLLVLSFALASGKRLQKTNGTLHHAINR